MSDFATQMAQLRANARPSIVNYGGQMISQKSTVKDTSGAHEQMLKTIESFRQNIAMRNPSFKTSQELVEDANMARQLISQLDDPQRRAVMLDKGAQQLRQRQAKLPGTQGMFMSARDFYNDPTIPEGYLEYTQATGQRVEAKTANAKVRTAEAEANQAEANVAYTKSATGLNEIQSKLAEIDLSQYPEEVRLKLEQAKATIDQINQGTTASKSQQQIAEAAAPGERDLTAAQTDYYRAQIDAENNKWAQQLQEKNYEQQAANVKELVNYGVEAVNAVVEKYSALGSNVSLYAADYADDMLSEVNHIIMGASTAGLDTEYPIKLEDGSQVSIALPAALTNPTLQSVVAKTFDESYSAFVSILDKSAMLGDKGYQENANDLIDIYDKSCKAWAEVFGSIYYLESAGVMNQIPGLSDQIYTWAGVRDELEFMRYTIMHSGKVYDPKEISSGYNEEEKRAFDEEGKALGKRWAGNMPYRPSGFFKSFTPTQTIPQSLGRADYDIFAPGAGAVDSSTSSVKQSVE